MPNHNQNIKASINKSPIPKDFGELARWYPWKLLKPATPTHPMPGPNRAQRRQNKKG